MTVFSTLMSLSHEDESCMRVCMRVSLILMSWSNGKSCMKVDESREARICMRIFSTLMSWSNEDETCRYTRVEKREIAKKISSSHVRSEEIQLSSPPPPPPVNWYKMIILFDMVLTH